MAAPVSATIPYHQLHMLLSEFDQLHLLFIQGPFQPNNLQTSEQQSVYRACNRDSSDAAGT